MKIIDYLRNTKAEFSHVVWPTKRQTTIFSMLVVILSIVTAYFLGLFDFIFSKILQFFIA